MEVTSAYLYTTGDLPQMFTAIQKAQVPPKFRHGFLQALGFKSTNDRAFINVLKGWASLIPTPHRRRSTRTSGTRADPSPFWRSRFGRRTKVISKLIFLIALTGIAGALTTFAGLAEDEAS